MVVEKDDTVFVHVKLYLSFNQPYGKLLATLEYNDAVLFPLTWMVDFIVNVISGI